MRKTFDRETWRPQLAAWCTRALVSRPAKTLLEAGTQSTVIGLHLEDGRDVVVKVRPAEQRLNGCQRVQRHVHMHGFPCPEPLAGPTALGRYVATAERYAPGGEQLPESPDHTERFAKALARLTRSMPPVTDIPALDPPHAWAWWNHGSRRLWPPPSEGDVDLNAHT